MSGTHTGDLTELSSVNLTDAEREALLTVMQRAKEFDQKYSTSQPLEGKLLKWTNPLKGWQLRWFYVDHQQSVLHYYTSEERRKHPPRGSLHLWGAMVAPSEEDSQTFTVNGSSGDVYKLRAVDAKERQFWVSRLRGEVERCTNSSFGTPYNKGTVKKPMSSSPAPATAAAPTSTATEKPDHTPSHTPSHTLTPVALSPTRSLSKRLKSKLKGRRSREQSQEPTPERDDTATMPGGDAMLEVLTRLQCYQDSLVMQLESYSTPAGLSPLDKNVLLLKATSEAALHSIKECLAQMKHEESKQQSSQHVESNPGALSPSTSSSAVLQPPAQKPDKEQRTPQRPARPQSSPNLDEDLDLLPEARSRTLSASRTPKKLSTSTPV